MAELQGADTKEEEEEEDKEDDVFICQLRSADTAAQHPAVESNRHLDRLFAFVNITICELTPCCAKSRTSGPAARSC